MGLFRLIKLTADFEWLTFVLAMDCSAIIRTVGGRFGGDDEGRRFLEKIVQVPIRLPTVPHTKLREFTLQQVDRVLVDLKIELIQDETDRFRGCFDPTLMPLIRTPRSAKQFANVIRFSLGLLPGEVNPVDVMILEGIRLFAPDLFDSISAHIIPKVDAHWLEDMFEERDDRAEKLIEQILAGLDESKAKEWRQLLVMLFPAKLSRATYGESKFLAWTDSKRVACDEYLVRYLAAVIPESDVPDAEVGQWKNDASNEDDRALAAKLSERLTSKNEAILVQKLRRIQRQLNDTQRATFAVAISRLADQFTQRDIADLSEVAFGQSAIFAAQCVGDINNPEVLEKTASEVVKHSSSGIWSVEFFWSMRHKHERRQDDDNEEKFLPEETTKRLGILLAHTLIDGIQSSISRPSIELLRRAFLITERYGDLDRVRRWTKSELTKDRTFIRPLVSLMMQGLYSGGERDQEWPGDKEALCKVRAYTDEKWLAETFSPEQPEKRSRRTTRITDEEAVFRLLQLLKQPVRDDPEMADSSGSS